MKPFDTGYSRWANNVIEPVSRTKYPTLFRAVVRAIVGYQPFRNSMLDEDSFEMIDDSDRADVCCFRMIGNLLYKSKISRYSVPFQWNRSVARVCQACLARRLESVSLSCWRHNLCAWHCAHDLTISSMAWLKPQHKTASLARSLPFSASRCA